MAVAAIAVTQAFEGNGCNAKEHRHTARGYSRFGIWCALQRRGQTMNEGVVKLHDGTSHFNVGRNATATRANVTIECVGRCEHDKGVCQEDGGRAEK